MVEVRLDASPEAARFFSPPLGWAVARIQWGDTIFIRREQSLEPSAVETMLIEMLNLAAANGMRFHSWIHGSSVD
jgi:hypothetical protein